MSAISWLLFAVCAATALLLVIFLYRKRETPGRGRTFLAALRGLAVVILILLLFDPELPTSGLAGGLRGTQVVADASLSMALPTQTRGQTRWSQAAQQARQLAGAREVLLFGDEVRAVSPDSLPAITPEATSSRLLPALQAASEAGARRVVVLTDGGIEDAAVVSRWLPRLGLDIDFRTLAEPTRNAALAEIDAPSWAEAGKPLDIHFGVAAAATVNDTVEVSLLQGETVLATESVALPEAGRVASGTLRVTPEAPPDGGLVRFDMRLTAGDIASDDDVRSVYVFVSEEPAGIVLISLQPDWEPRFLQPVLEQSLGIPVRGYLRTRGDLYVRTAGELDAEVLANEEEVRRVVGTADMVVLHGVDAQAPAWVHATMSQARRLLVLPAVDGVGLSLPVQLGRATPGDWYVSAELPPTPVASLLAGIDLTDVPPLAMLHFGQLPPGAWSPLLASRGRRGLATPILAAGETATRRWAVALGMGYWRWAFRGGEIRQVYARFWGAVGGWLMQEHDALAAASVRPAERVVQRGAPVRWIAPGLAPDSMRIRITDATGASVRDTAIVTAGADTASMPRLLPGHYAYEVTAFAGDTAASAEGPLTVESFSPEFTRPAVTLAMLEANAVPVGADARARRGRPLHTAAWPYIAVVLLVALEWVLRRRWGLR